MIKKFFAPGMFALAFLFVLALPARAQTCQASCSVTGAVNDYWVGSGNPVAGASSITLGARRGATEGAIGGATIAAGDMLLVIQMQDALINTGTGTNNTTYGANNGTGAGYTNSRQSGLYEFVRATNAVGTAGGTLNLQTSLVNGYFTNVADAQLTRRFQVVRVPNCVTMSLSGTLTAPAWNGDTGGVVALYGAAVDLGGATINADYTGFRGGATDAHNAPDDSGNWRSNDDNDQHKGEGIAGTPRYIYNRATGVEINTGRNFPSGNRARGAPATGGGGGEGDSGSGGGGNGGAGGRGGTWSDIVDAGGSAAGTDGGGGGRGGAAFAERAYGRVVLGGGGGGGSAGNDNGDAEGTVPFGTGVRPFSRGGAGGGIVILNAGTRTGSLTINARGESGPFTAGTANAIQVGGGGGAGGSAVLYGSGGTINVNASGGDGATAQRAIHRAHGGGGGGGIVFATSAAGISINTAAGRAGCTAANTLDSASTSCDNANNSNGSRAGTAGPATVQTFAPAAPGGPTCLANFSVTKSSNVSPVTAGQPVTYTINAVNSGPSAASGAMLTDAATAGLTCTSVGCSSNPNGNCPAAGSVTIANLFGGGIPLTSFPVNSTLTFTVGCGVTATGN